MPSTDAGRESKAVQFCSVLYRICMHACRGGHSGTQEPACVRACLRAGAGLTSSSPFSSCPSWPPCGRPSSACTCAPPPAGKGWPPASAAPGRASASRRARCCGARSLWPCTPRPPPCACRPASSALRRRLPSSPSASSAPARGSSVPRQPPLSTFPSRCASPRASLGGRTAHAREPSAPAPGPLGAARAPPRASSPSARGSAGAPAPSPGASSPQT
mmetsp:Transcript_89224/g.266142  ORF Transcript_89224/g.266142 Transcript_89224/m.266142 type:complete len:217 (+) Transcript_89224:3734-4384(+)